MSGKLSSMSALLTTDSSSSARANSGRRPADQFLVPWTSPPWKAKPSLQVLSPPIPSTFVPMSLSKKKKKKRLFPCTLKSVNYFCYIKFVSTNFWDLSGWRFCQIFVMPWQQMRTCLHVVVLLMLSQFTKFTMNPQLACCSAPSRTRANT